VSALRLFYGATLDRPELARLLQFIDPVSWKQSCQIEKLSCGVPALAGCEEGTIRLAKVTS
jgi:hypothetical protein